MCVPGRPPLVILAHSIGSYIATHALRRYEERYCNDSNTVSTISVNISLAHSTATTQAFAAAKPLPAAPPPLPIAAPAALDPREEHSQASGQSQSAGSSVTPHFKSGFEAGILPASPPPATPPPPFSTEAAAASSSIHQQQQQGQTAFVSQEDVVLSHLPWPSWHGTTSAAAGNSTSSASSSGRPPVMKVGGDHA